MLIDLPTSPEAFANATWDDIAPYYERLATVPVTADTAEEWLRTWSRLEELVAEAGTVTMIDYTCDTADPRKEEAYLRFASEIFPKADEAQVKLQRRLLALGWERDDLRTTLRGFRTDAEIFREENVPLHSELEGLDAQYQKITGGLTVEWEGETKTIPQLNPFLQAPERDVRERAFRKGAEAYLEKRDEMASLFDRMYELRQRVARNAGFADFEKYVFAAKHRFDYGPDDCRRFHEAVEATVVPAVERLHAHRKASLAVDTLRPWDIQVDPLSRPALKPFADTPQFVGTAERIFERVDPQLGDWFREMARDGLLDLESRQGKAPGGYCTKLASRQQPFIFMNAVGVTDDVNTLLHEAGHCFHAYEARHHPFIWQRGTGSEAAELASMSMELLAAPYLAVPHGYYDEEGVRRAWVDHLEDILTTLPHIASVDAFQSWIYTSPDGADAGARDREWLRIRERFEKGVDWTGLERERVARWYRQLHIFQYPFYYIEYGIAQLGALQVWRNARKDPKEAVRQYRAALALGGTRPLPEIFGAAGAKLAFDAGTMGELVAMVEERIAELR